MITRRATLTDLSALASLFDAYRVFYKKASDINGAKSFLTERLTRDESVIFVVVDDGELLGFVQLYPIFS